MQSTWKRSPSRCSRAPTTSATAPPMPASTSSKMSVLPGRVGRGERFQREHDARQLAARRDARQRPAAPRPDWARCRTPLRRCRGRDHALFPAASREAHLAPRRGPSRDRRAPVPARGRTLPPASAAARRERAGEPRIAERAPARAAASSSATPFGRVLELVQLLTERRPPLRCTSASVGPCFFFRRSSSAQGDPRSPAAAPAMRRCPAQYERRKNARSSSCDLTASRASRYGANRGVERGELADLLPDAAERRQRGLVAVVQRRVGLARRAAAVDRRWRAPAASAASSSSSPGCGDAIVDFRELEREELGARRLLLLACGEPLRARRAAAASARTPSRPRRDRASAPANASSRSRCAAGSSST